MNQTETMNSARLSENILYHMQKQYRSACISAQSDQLRCLKANASNQLSVQLD